MVKKKNSMDYFLSYFQGLPQVFRMRFGLFFLLWRICIQRIKKNKINDKLWRDTIWKDTKIQKKYMHSIYPSFRAQRPFWQIENLHMPQLYAFVEFSWWKSLFWRNFCFHWKPHSTKMLNWKIHIKHKVFNVTMSNLRASCSNGSWVEFFRKCVPLLTISYDDWHLSRTKWQERIRLSRTICNKHKVDFIHGLHFSYFIYLRAWIKLF